MPESTEPRIAYPEITKLYRETYTQHGMTAERAFVVQHKHQDDFIAWAFGRKPNQGSLAETIYPNITGIIATEVAFQALDVEMVRANLGKECLARHDDRINEICKDCLLATVGISNAL